jgi:hypothetical protein
MYGNMDEPGRHDVKCKKSDTHVLTYMQKLKKWNSEIEEWCLSDPGRSGGGEDGERLVGEYRGALEQEEWLPVFYGTVGELWLSTIN